MAKRTKISALSLPKLEIPKGVNIGDYCQYEKAMKTYLTESIGRVHMLIVKGEVEEIKAKFKQYSPIICDILPLSLEEVFIYELGGMGYEFENIIL